MEDCQPFPPNSWTIPIIALVKDTIVAANNTGFPRAKIFEAIGIVYSQSTNITDIGAHRSSNGPRIRSKHLATIFKCKVIPNTINCEPATKYESVPTSISHIRKPVEVGVFCIAIDPYLPNQ